MMKNQNVQTESYCQLLFTLTIKLLAEYILLHQWRYQSEYANAALPCDGPEFYGKLSAF